MDGDTKVSRKTIQLSCHSTPAVLDLWACSPIGERWFPRSRSMLELKMSSQLRIVGPTGTLRSRIVDAKNASQRAIWHARARPPLAQWHQFLLCV